MALIVKSPTHHICLLNLALDHAVGDIATHDNIVFLDDCNSSSSVHGILTLLIQLLLRLLWAALMTVVLLSLDDVASKHLRILDFNLRVVENVVIIVDVFDNLDGLVLRFLLWLWWATSSLMRSMDARMATWLLEAGMTHRSSLTTLGGCKVISVGICVVVGTLMPLVSSQVAISVEDLILVCEGLCASLLLNIIMLIGCSRFRIMLSGFVLLIDNLFWIINTILRIIFDTLSLQDFRAALTWLIKVKLLRFGVFIVPILFSFAILLLGTLFILILRTFNGVSTWGDFARWFPSHGSSSLISISGSRTLNSFIISGTIRIWQRSILRTLNLGFLLFIKFGAFQATFDAVLGLVVMNFYFFGKINSLINGYYFGQWLLFFRVGICLTRRSFSSRIIIFLLINPLEGFLPIFVLHLAILNDLAHLCIQESISNDHFFLLEVFLETFALKGQVVKIEW